MKKLKTTTLFLFLFIGSVLGDNPEYAVNKIPLQLINNADLIVRNHSKIYEVVDKGKAYESYHLVVTLLNRNAMRSASHFVRYDKFTKIKKFDGEVYDQKGEVIKKFKKSDIKDYSSISNFSLYEDNRVQLLEYTPPSYPITVAFEVEIEYEGILAYPNFKPLTQSKMAIQNASLKILIPEPLKLKYKSINFDNEPEVASQDNNNSYYWQASNWLAIEKWEVYKPDYHKQSPQVVIAPEVFEYDGYAGSLQSWQSFGQWIFNLAKERDVLPPATVAKLQSMTAGMSQLEKIEKLYQFMQEKTRYVSIQLGIGGFQPFEASLVDEVSYGDCKALSNYMRALLKAVDINSYLTAINAGDDHQQILTDFPMFQFNHMILCVPVAQDTVWLECTSSIAPMGHLGKFTGHRYALVTNENGGALVKTRSYDAENNAQIRKIDVTIDEEGNAQAKVKTSFFGYQLSSITRYMLLSTEEQKKKLYESLDVSGLNIENFSFDNNNQCQDLALSSMKYATLSGKRIFLNPNFMNRLDYDMPQTDKRICDVKIDYPFYDVDTVVYTLPPGYYTEYLPEAIEKESDFGFYKAYFLQDSDDKIMYIRKVKRYRGVYAPEKYEEFRSFFNAISGYDNVKIVLKNTT